MREKIVFLVALMFLIMVPCFVFGFDKQPGELFLPEHPENSYVSVVVEGIAEGIVSDGDKLVRRQGEFSGLGSGFVVRHGIVLTNAHVIVPEKVRIKNGRGDSLVAAIKVITRKIFIFPYVPSPDNIDKGIPAEADVVDEKNDMAMLTYNADCFEPVEYPLNLTFEYSGYPGGGMNSVIQKGDAIALVARKRNTRAELTEEFEVRYGFVENRNPETTRREDLPRLSVNDFTLSLVIYDGDSGLPIIVWKDGKPVIIGIVRAGEGDGKNGLKYAARIDKMRGIVGAE